MFVKYNYKVGATLANVMNDVEKLITGETNRNNLSTDCLIDTSEIYADVKAVWILHDPAAGTNMRVYKALRSDSSTVYTYIKLDYNTYINQGILVSLYETWNNVAHTGTNQCLSGAALYQRMVPASGGNLYIGAGGTGITNTDYLYMIGEVGGIFGSGGGNVGGLCVANHKRRMSWDTDAAGYPTTSIYHITQGSKMPRYRTLAGADVLSGTLNEYSRIGGNSIATIYITAREAVTNKYPATKRMLTSLLTGFTAGETIAPLYFIGDGNTTNTVPGPDGKTYFVVNLASSREVIPRF